MPLPDFESNSIAMNLLLYAGAAVVVWFSGFRLSQYADVIAERTGLGQAFLGLLLLAVVTSLPEVVTTVTAVTTGNPTLALSNFFGSIELNLLILAVADIFIGRASLTTFVPDPSLMLNGALVLFLLGLVGIGMITGEILSYRGIGLWPVVFVIAYLISVYLIYRYPMRATWSPINNSHNEEAETRAARGRQAAEAIQEKHAQWSSARLTLMTIVVAALILVGGTLLAMTSDAVAAQTGLGTTFIGATLLAAGTSLPELSTVTATVRLGNYGMALSNIFGSNAFMVVLIFISDLFYREGAILNEIDRAGGFAVMVGMVMTVAFLIGLIERRDRTILRAGYDSWVVIALYALSLAGLYAFSTS